MRILEMVLSKHFMFAILHSALVILPFLVQAQDQSGFISIDCGLSDVTSYTDETTGITYVSDTSFTEYGENRAISPTYKGQTDEQQLWNLRSFPQGTRNCYTLSPSQGKGTRYFIRARFMYGNYDNDNQSPTFDLYLGVDFWDTVRFDKVNNITKGIVHTPSSDRIHVCLVNTGYGTPFMSVLELRPLGSDIYTSENGTALNLVNHFDFSSASNKVERYKEDAYDRLWFPLNKDTWTPFINVSSTGAKSISKDNFEIPSTVMGTAYTQPENNSYMYLRVYELNSSSTYFLYMHFAELEILQTNQSREFNIYANDDIWYGEPESPRYLKTDTLYSTKGVKANKNGEILIWLNNTETATLPPLINAAEVYELKGLSGQDTYRTDAEAISGVKSWYGLKRLKWQGDPCGPEAYLWDGLNCSYTKNGPSRIVSLNLASSGLKGEIAASIANLSKLEYLDLSNNNLTGIVPEFLAQLSSLKLLNLTGNIQLTGPVPEALSKKKGLTLSLDAHLMNKNGSCSSCKSKKSFVAPLVASLGGVLSIVLIIVAVVWIRKRRLQNTATGVRVDTVNVEPGVEDVEFGSKKQQFTYSEMQRITSNFQRVLGEGGFGKVYHGYLNGNEVAVKMISASSIQGHRQFLAELKLLLRVHHKNLTILVGYCNEETNFGLIYEYMAMGNLRSHLSGGRRTVLSWEDRLRIAIDTAQGLEYLHNGCKPPIIHRDVKTTNILLNDKYQAKLGDFGLSKIFPSEGGNHISDTGNMGITTSIAGTPGYLDPEYYITNWLNEKSDVYSFGVVLLEIVTARPVLTKNGENNHIIQWVRSMVATGDIKNIIDPRLGGDCDINTVWKTIEIAMSCVSKKSSDRPTMSRVTTELKECLGSELIRRDGYDVNYLSKDSSVEMISSTTISEFSPVAR